MANATGPGGLTFSRMLDGSPMIAAVHKYVVGSSSAAIGYGSPVVKVAGGNTAAIANGTDRYEIGTLETVNAFVPGSASAITGVVLGIDPIATAPGSLLIAASPTANTRVVSVVDASKAEFQIRDDGVNTLTNADIGKGAFFIAGAAISTGTGQATMLLDTGATNALVTSGTTANCVILGGVPNSDNVIGGKNALWRVRLLNHTEAEGVGAAAV